MATGRLDEVFPPLRVVLADMNEAGAQFKLGVMYDTGRGAPRDSREAIRWYRMAADKGLVPAKYNLARMYASGDGVAQDDARAARLFREAAEQGFARAQYKLGRLHARGRGVAQDFAEAAKWYRTAAGQGNTYAMNNLGVMHEKGQGVPKDPGAAVRCFHRIHELCYSPDGCGRAPERCRVCRVPPYSVRVGKPVRAGLLDFASQASYS